MGLDLCPYAHTRVRDSASPRHRIVAVRRSHRCSFVERLAVLVRRQGCGDEPRPECSAGLGAPAFELVRARKIAYDLADK